MTTPLPRPSHDPAATATGRLVEAIRAHDYPAAAQVILQAARGKYVGRVGALLVSAICHGATDDERTASGIPDIARLTHCRDRDEFLRHAVATERPFHRAEENWPDAERCRPTMQKAVGLYTSLVHTDADRATDAVAQGFASAFRQDEKIAFPLLSMLAEAAVPSYGRLAADMMGTGRIHTLLDRAGENRDSVESVLQMARLNGVDMGEMETLAADVVGELNRKALRGPLDGVEVEQLAGMGELLERIRSHRAGKSEDLVPALADVLVDAAERADDALVYEITEHAVQSGIHDQVTAAILGRIEDLAPADFRLPGGRPDLHRAVGTSDRATWMETARSAKGPLGREADAAWALARAAVELLDAALSEARLRGRWDAATAVLRPALGARPELADPVVQTAAIAAAALTARAGQDAAQARAEPDGTLEVAGFGEPMDPATVVLPPYPNHGTEPLEADPADHFDFHQPVTAVTSRWRGKLRRQLLTPESVSVTAEILDDMTLVPAVASPLEAAQILLGQEDERLLTGAVWLIDGRLTRLATAQRFDARELPVTWDRVPGKRGMGFMQFEHAIGQMGRQSVVAVSWGPWRADWSPHPGAIALPVAEPFGRPVWWHTDMHPSERDQERYFNGKLDAQGRDRSVGLLVEQPGVEFVWLTFWTPSLVGQKELPLVRAGEMVVPIGACLPAEPSPASRWPWARVVFACWDRLTDPQREPGQLVAAVEQVVVELPDNRAKDKKRKSGKRTDAVSVARVEEVPTPRQPRPAPAVEEPAAVPSPRGPLTYGYTVVTTGTRKFCTQTHKHREYRERGEECPHHEERPIVPSYKVRPDLEQQPTKRARHAT
ncbi:hypothetical protein [Kitasatospora purpeofusca]|uniref:hypothetical protein n=1 Tax=Kitasatospora purpeofusca TaxID=67352 RepID=UPI0036CE1AC8